MTDAPGKTPKKAKEKRPSPQDRLASIRYSHMMYGPTAGEMRPTVRKADLGAPYLNHPKFQSLMSAFKRGAAYTFDVTDKGKVYPVATAEFQITFGGRVVYYARPANRYEDHLLLDRSTALHYQAVEAFAHLVFAVLRSLPDLENPPLTHLRNQFYWDGETLDVGIAQQGPNQLLGGFRHGRPLERPTR